MSKGKSLIGTTIKVKNIYDRAINVQLCLLNKDEIREITIDQEILNLVREKYLGFIIEE